MERSLQPSPRKLVATAVVALLALVGTASAGSGCGGQIIGPDGTTNPQIREPAVHRVSASACPTDRAPGLVPPPGSDDAGPPPDDVDAAPRSDTGGGPAADAGPYPSECFSDFDCRAGKNGRCIASRIRQCSYDTCFADADCGSGALCACRPNAKSNEANRCLAGNCKLDADCGKGNYCSPSKDTSCGWSVVGYFCHTKTDECIDDTDCKGEKGGTGPGGYPGYCAWTPTVGKWKCSYSICAG